MSLVPSLVQDPLYGVSVTENVVCRLSRLQADLGDALRDQPYQLSRMRLHVMPLPALVVYGTCHVFVDNSQSEGLPVLWEPIQE